MRFFSALLILLLMFFAHLPMTFAQDDSVSPQAPEMPEPGTQLMSVEMMPTPSMNIPQPAQAAPSEPALVEVPSVEIENEEDSALDSHIIIENVSDSDEKMSDSPVLEHNSFNRIKQLAGRWEGVGANNDGEKQEKITVTYEVTAGGHAVLERIYPGTPQEMITIYYENNGKLTLMHFFMMGTRSIMALNAVTGDKEPFFDFSLVDHIPGLDPEVDTHMHSLRISFVGDNHMNQIWTMFEAGKLSGTYAFNLTRPPNN